MKASCFSAALLTLLLGCGSHTIQQRNTMVEYPGEQWLTWSTTERNYFVIGCLQGYGDALVEACKTAKKMLDPIELSQEPNSRPYSFDERDCFARVPTYTKLKFAPSKEPDASAYTQIITEFYSNYPQYRNIPYLYLMQFLRGERLPSATDIGSLAQSGKIRTHW